MQRERAVQVTVVEYINEFFTQYSRRAYGKTVVGNASKGAEVFMGMLKLVLSRGGRDELRIALHCFKDQLTAAINSPPSVRQQQVEEVFALLSALIDAAERLRQFSPVKEQLSAAVLEEVRFRLYRIIVGDGFCEDVVLRRRALDISFTAMMREADEAERSRARINKLSCTGASPAAAVAAAGAAAASTAAAPTTAGSGALVLAGHYHHQATATTGAGHAGGDAAAKGPGRLRGSLQRKAAALGGPDYSSWEGLWASLGSMAPKRMLPLLQAVMTDLYLGKLMPGTPGAAAAATTSQAGASSNLSSSSNCGAAATPRGVSAPTKQPPQQQQVEATIHLQQPQRPLKQQRQQPQQQQGEAALVSASSQDHSLSSNASSPNSTAARDAAGLLVNNGSGEVWQAADTAAAEAPSSSTQPHEQQQEQQQSQPRQQQQQPQQPSRFGRSSARAAHPIAAGYGASSSSYTSCDSTPTAVATISINSTSSAAVAAGSSSFNSSGSSPKQSSSPAAESRGAFAALASRLSGGGSNKDRSSASAVGSNSSSSSPVGAGSKWGGLVSGGFLGLQSTSTGSSSIGSGRLIPRGWVQFGAQHASTQQQQQEGGVVGGAAAAAAAEAAAASPSAAVTPDSDAASDSDTAGMEEPVADAGLQQKQQQQQQQLDRVASAVEPCTPAVAASNRETGMPRDNSGGSSLHESEHGFDGEEPDWGSGGSSSNCCSLKPSGSASVHCTPAAPAPVPSPTPAAAGLKVTAGAVGDTHSTAACREPARAVSWLGAVGVRDN